MIADLPLVPSIAAPVLGYLFGSVPFGLVLTRAAGLGDIRKIGSGSIGATNVLRTGNKPLAVATMLLDALKGAVAVWIVGYVARRAGLPEETAVLLALLAGFAAVIGHLFPVWLGFRGGKGVATYVGLLLAVYWPALLVFAVLWLGTAFISRYSSLSALVATALTPAALIYWGQTDAAVLFSILTVIVWAKHHGNIRRLLTGTESRIGQKG